MRDVLRTRVKGRVLSPNEVLIVTSILNQKDLKCRWTDKTSAEASVCVIEKRNPLNRPRPSLGLT